MKKKIRAILVRNPKKEDVSVGYKRYEKCLTKPWLKIKVEKGRDKKQ